MSRRQMNMKPAHFYPRKFFESTGLKAVAAHAIKKSDATFSLSPFFSFPVPVSFSFKLA